LTSLGVTASGVTTLYFNFGTAVVEVGPGGSGTISVSDRGTISTRDGRADLEIAPEPASIAMAGIGLSTVLGLAVRRRRAVC
jgi:hypothetical protein